MAARAELLQPRVEQEVTLLLHRRCLAGSLHHRRNLEVGERLSGVLCPQIFFSVQTFPLFLKPIRDTAVQGGEGLGVDILDLIVARADCLCQFFVLHGSLDKGSPHQQLDLPIVRQHLFVQVAVRLWCTILLQVV